MSVEEVSKEEDWNDEVCRDRAYCDRGANRRLSVARHCRHPAGRACRRAWYRPDCVASRTRVRRRRFHRGRTAPAQIEITILVEALNEARFRFVLRHREVDDDRIGNSSDTQL